MYWYKIISPLTRGFFLICCLALASCRPDIKESKGQYKYFDLKGFMRKDSARLSKAEPVVIKSVSHNGDQQTKTLKIANWGHELGLFTSSDINKPSWRESYKTSSRGNAITYQAMQPELKTQKLEIIKAGDSVKAIQIYNHTKNLLYETSETLTYIPDSVYTINKTQHVLLLGTNTYLIKGVFRH